MITRRTRGIIMPEDIPPPVDCGWFTPLQHEALLRVVASPDGFVRIAELYDTVRQRVDVCRERSLTSGEIIRNVLAQTRDGFPGIDNADLLSVTPRPAVILLRGT
jgi:hypothetical protein